MEWDTAAGDAVLRAAGGRVTDLEGQPLRYGKPGFENPLFLAQGKEGASEGQYPCFWPPLPWRRRSRQSYRRRRSRRSYAA